MAGTINLAFTQQFDAQAAPLSGGLLYFFTAGTTTPQSAFQDTGLTIQHPNPIVLDASGRVPMFYVADGFIKIRMTDKNGIVVIAADQLLVIGPSTSGGGGGGGGSGGDVTQLISTGDIKARYGTNDLDGFVRCNGRTIGNVGSSATERADPICRPLYEYLYPFPNILPDIGQTKSGSASTDFTGGIRLILPDLRGRTIAGMDDMGAAAINRLTNSSSGFGTSATVLGAVGGNESHKLTLAQAPTHVHDILSSGIPGGLATISVEDHDHTHNIPAMDTGIESTKHTHNINAINAAANIAISGTNTVGDSHVVDFNSGQDSVDHTHTIPAGTYKTGGINSDATSATHRHTLGGSTQNAGSDGFHPNVQPSMVLTFYMKL